MNEGFMGLGFHLIMLWGLGKQTCIFKELFPPPCSAESHLMTVKHSRRHFYNFMVNLFIIHVNRHILAKNNCVSSETNICGTAVPALLCIVALLQRPVLMFRSVNMSTKNIEYMRCLRSAYACSVKQALIKGFRSSELEWKNYCHVVAVMLWNIS